jgi:hypothetical protein
LPPARIFPIPNIGIVTTGNSVFLGNWGGFIRRRGRERGARECIALGGVLVSSTLCQ